MARPGDDVVERAFRGELVPQDPSGEPAAALLARIRAAREEGAAAKKPPRALQAR